MHKRLLFIFSLLVFKLTTYSQGETIPITLLNGHSRFLIEVIPENIDATYNNWSSKNNSTTIESGSIMSSTLGIDTVFLYHGTSVIATLPIQTIEYVAPEKVTAKPENLYLTENEETEIKLSFLPLNSTYYSIDFFSYNDSIVSVDSKGKVKAKKKGSTYILVTYKPSTNTTRIPVTVKSCYVQPPAITEELIICNGAIPIYTSIFENTFWYGDSLKQNILSTGKYFTPQYNGVGEYNFWIVNRSQFCDSEIKKTTLKVINPPPQINASTFKSSYYIDEISDTVFTKNKKRLNWYETNNLAEPAYSASFIPTNLGKGLHKFLVNYEETCESKMFELQFAIIDEDQIVITGDISPKKIKSKIRLHSTDNTTTLNYIEPNSRNEFIAICNKNYSYKIEANPENHEKHLTTFYGNTILKSNAKTIDTREFSIVDVNIVLKEKKRHTSIEQDNTLLIHNHDLSIDEIYLRWKGLAYKLYNEVGISIKSGQLSSKEIDFNYRGFFILCVYDQDEIISQKIFIE